jgi:hypothetical protein
MKKLTTIGILSLVLFVCMSAKPVSHTNRIQFKASTATASFDFFRTHHQGRGIAATWGLKSTGGVNGFQVRKTYEDPSDPAAEWSAVYSTACNGSKSYKCVDNQVDAGFVSYQVIAEMADGSTVASDISVEHIVSH